METELWKDIPEIPRYQASNTGRIRSWCRIGRNQDSMSLSPHILSQNQMKNSKGKRTYLTVTIHVDKQQRGMLVHCLVLSAFLGPCPTGMEGCHFDGNPMNNNINNLRWDTSIENHADMVRHGHSPVGERSTLTKLTTLQVIEIREMRASGAMLKTVSAHFSIPIQTIYNICVGNSWRSVGGPIEPPRVKRPHKTNNHFTGSRNP